MFAAGWGVYEDPATGSAAAAFAGVMMAFEPPGDGEHMLTIEQGVEMGRPSFISLGLDVRGRRPGRCDDRRLRYDRLSRERSTFEPAAHSRNRRTRLPPGAAGLAVRSRERAADIAAHWEARRASQPSLFNGRVLLLGRHEIATRADGKLALRGAYFEVDFAAFLAWRDFGFPGGEVCNGFSMAALRGADGAFLLGEMAAHTANAGAVYFAAGTPDRQDVFGERVDLTASVTRELEEETGVPASETHYDGNWTVIYDPPRIACMKIMRLDVSSDRCKDAHRGFSGERSEAGAVADAYRAPGERSRGPARAGIREGVPRSRGGEPAEVIDAARACRAAAVRHGRACPVHPRAYAWMSV